LTRKMGIITKRIIPSIAKEGDFAIVKEKGIQ
jgi:hypothetical protein